MTISTSSCSTNFVVVDASVSRPLARAVHLFLGFENLFDVEYDVARTPVRSIGWPFTDSRRRQGVPALETCLFSRRSKTNPAARTINPATITAMAQSGRSNQSRWSAIR